MTPKISLDEEERCMALRVANLIMLFNQENYGSDEPFVELGQYYRGTCAEIAVAKLFGPGIRPMFWDNDIRPGEPDIITPKGAIEVKSCGWGYSPVDVSLPLRDYTYIVYFREIQGDVQVLKILTVEEIQKCPRNYRGYQVDIPRGTWAEIEP